MLKKYLRRFFFWLFKGESEELARLRDEVNRHKVILRSANVGVDVGYGREESWACVCIKGKPDIITFVDLRERDIREISDFLRYFKKENVVIDAPRQIWGGLKSRLY